MGISDRKFFCFVVFFLTGMMTIQEKFLVEGRSLNLDPCQQPGGPHPGCLPGNMDPHSPPKQANPYSRGCSKIKLCRSGLPDTPPRLLWGCAWDRISVALVAFGYGVYVVMSERRKKKRWSVVKLYTIIGYQVVEKVWIICLYILHECVFFFLLYWSYFLFWRKWK